MFRTSEISKVKIVVDESEILKGIIVRFSIELDEDVIRKVFYEAQKKYQRMHYESSEQRFDKSWTGEVGENTVKEILQKVFSLKISAKPGKLTETGYDYGDVHFGNSIKFVANVTSRKLSKYDNEINIFTRPDQYYVLIPRDQLKHYTERSNFCFPVFIRYTEFKSYTLQEHNLEIPVAGVSVVPGFLRREDILALVEKRVVFLKRKGKKLKGLYDDLRYSIPMYTDNYIIPVNLLRNLEVFKYDLSSF